MAIPGLKSHFHAGDNALPSVSRTLPFTPFIVALCGCPEAAVGANTWPIATASPKNKITQLRIANSPKVGAVACVISRGHARRNTRGISHAGPFNEFPKCR
jgi:hypothetical protein